MVFEGMSVKQNLRPETHRRSKRIRYLFAHEPRLIRELVVVSCLFVCEAVPSVTTRDESACEGICTTYRSECWDKMSDLWKVHLALRGQELTRHSQAACWCGEVGNGYWWCGYRLVWLAVYRLVG
jgi:hypothetical protein